MEEDYPNQEQILKQKVEEEDCQYQEWRTMERHSPVPHHSPGGHGCGVQGVVKEPRRWDYDC